MFENKPEYCPFGHELWPGKVQVSWTPCVCEPAREAARRGRGMGHVRVTCNSCHDQRLAETASQGGYGIVGLHIQVGTEQHGFHTKRQPDSFTDMVTSACVMAQLELLKRAASVFGWDLDAARVDELIAEATAMNNADAQGETPLKPDD